MNSKTKAMLKTVKLFESVADTTEKWRPKFHLSPKTGWMNDPNGLCQKDGIYHIYFQYSPFDTAPGTNYWGHFSTKDFQNYDYHKPALYVDEKFDCHGVYSGSALTDNEGITVFFTGNVKQNGDFDYIIQGREHNTISAFSKDGIEFESKKLLLENCDYPADCTCHVRDPKVWQEDEKYYMVLGSRRKDDVGEVLIFTSDNLEKWELCNRLTSSEKFGFMWECPDIFNLDGKTFLAISPQGVDAQGYKYQNVYQSGYFALDGDFKSNCQTNDFHEYDHGFDFYAPQSFVDEGGRRILIGWLGMPDIEGIYENPTTKFGWVHMLTCPRELSVSDNGKLCQYPLKELISGDNQCVNCNGKLGIDKLKVFKLNIDFAISDDFEINILSDCKITYKHGVLSLSFGKSGYGRDVRSTLLSEISKLLILVDTSSIEIFANKGECVFSSRFYPEDNESGVKITNVFGEVSYGSITPIKITDR